MPAADWYRGISLAATASMDSDVWEGDQKAPIGLPQNHTCIHRCVNEGTSKRGQETKLGTYKPNN